MTEIEPTCTGGERSRAPQQPLASDKDGHYCSSADCNQRLSEGHVCDSEVLNAAQPNIYYAAYSMAGQTNRFIALSPSIAIMLVCSLIYS